MKISRWFIILVTASLFIAVGAQAQTTVNLTVTDTPDNQAWASGTWAVQLQPAPGSLSQTRTFILTGGGSLSPQSGALSGTGTASITLPANANIGPASTWQFTVCPQASSGCFQQGVTVTTSSPQTLNITPPSIRINLAIATPPVSAYTTAEVTNAVLGSTFFLIGTGPQFCNAVSNGTCTAWSGISGGGAPAFSSVTSGTNINTLLVGSGGSLGPSGSGTITATTMPWSGLTGFPAACPANQVAVQVGATIGCASLTKSYLPGVTVYTDQSNTFSTGTQDFSAVSLFKGRTSAGLTTSTNGDFGFDTTNNNWHFWNGADLLMVPLASGFVSGHCGQPTSVGGKWTFVDPGFACGSGGGGGLTASGNSANQVAYWTSGTNLSGTGPGLTGQLLTANNAAPPTFNSFGIAGRSVSITSDTILCDSGTALRDRATTIQYTSASAVAVTLPDAGSAGCSSNFVFSIAVTGAGTVTVTRQTASTITWVNGFSQAISQTSVALPQNTWVTFSSPDNSNWIVRGVGITTLPNSALTNTATTVNTQTCTLGSTCTVTPANVFTSNFNAHQFWGNNTGSATTPSASLIGGSDTGPNEYAADSGAVNAYVIAPTPAITSLAVNARAAFTTTNANTSASTINVSSLGVKNLTKKGSTALTSGDILANAVYDIRYDGTQWEVLNPSTGSGGATSVDGSASNGVQTIQGGAVAAITSSGTVQASQTVDSQTAVTSFAHVNADRGKLLVRSNSGTAMTDTLSQAAAGATAAFGPGWFEEVLNTDATANLQITATTSTFSSTGTTVLNLPAGTWCKITSDGTNYKNLCSGGSPAITSTTAVTVSNPTINTDTKMIELSLPKGYLNTLGQGFLIRAGGLYSNTAATSPALTFNAKLCTVSGCGSGTVVGLAQIVSGATSATLTTNNTWTYALFIITSATGPTGNVLAKADPGLTIDLSNVVSAPDTVYTDVNTAASGNIDLTAALFLDFTVAQSVAGATNSYKQLSAMIAPQSNPSQGISDPCASGGTAGQVCTSNGAGVTPAFKDFPEVHHFAAANQAGGVAGSAFSLGTCTVSTRSGTNVVTGVVVCGSAQTFQIQDVIPLDWDSATLPFFRLFVTQGSNTTSGQTITFQVQGACGTTDDAAFNTAQNLSSSTTTTTANQQYQETIQANSTTMTSCAAGSVINFKFTASTVPAGGSPNIQFVNVTWPTLPAVQAN